MTWTSWGHTFIKKARDQHLCTWCDEYIDKGSTYYRWRSKDSDDDPMTSRMHIECVSASEGWPDEYYPGQFRRGCICARDDVPCEKCAARGVTE